VTETPVTILEAAPAQWNDLVRAGRGGPAQAGHYAAYWRARFGYRPFFLVAGDPAGPAGVLLAYQYSPLTRLLAGRPGAKALVAATWPLLRSAASRYGPVILDPERRTETTLALLRAAARLAGLGRGRYFHSALQVYLDRPPDPDLVARLARLGGRVVEGLTPLLDLDPDPEIIFKRVDHQARKAVRQAEKQGLTIEELDGADPLAAAGYVALEAQAKGLGSPDPALAAETARHLGRPGFGVRYFVCRRSGEPVAGLGVHLFGDVAAELAAWSTKLARAERLAGGDLVKWAALRWAAGQGARVFDLMGINPRPQGAKEEGIARFKKKWSSRLAPVYSLRSRAALTPH
jgi:hypothetical protein